MYLLVIALNISIRIKAKKAYKYQLIQKYTKTFSLHCHTFKVLLKIIYIYQHVQMSAQKIGMKEHVILTNTVGHNPI